MYRIVRSYLRILYKESSPVNLLKIRLLFLFFVIVPFCSASHAPSALEFKHAVVRYIKHTDTHCLQHTQRHGDENIPYKKELRYLFKNYNTISISALLSRLRSAHQEMVKIETDVASDTFKKYEQISSALLLICAQSFFYDTRNQILNALDEIDQLIIYWRYQQHHQLRYFFSKSPHKWVMGQSQAKEIAHNVIKLERKQRELYTMLGALAAHAHALTTCDINYDDCYAWVNGLLAVVPYTSENSENVEFDIIATQLALRMKKMDVLQHDLLRSLAATRKPSHFVQYWITYTTMASAAAYITYYHTHNPGVIPAAAQRTSDFVQGVIKSVVVDPMTDLYQVFFGIDAKGSVDNIEKRVDAIEKLANDVKANVSQLSKDQAKSLREYAEGILKATLEKMNVVNKDQILADVAKNNLESLNALCKDTGWSAWTFDSRLDQETVRILLLVDEILNLLIPYLDLLDQNILPLTQEIGFLFVDLGHIVGDFIKNNFWTAKLAAFTPLAATCVGSVKTYKWMTAHDYSPIRIALADVNALLIESGTQLNDYAYGKLLYLVFKLRNRADSLKDPLAHEFLADVAKLESKQYGSETKHSIVENMFNKYAFLGRIAL
jgi:hypothetical protein